MDYRKLKSLEDESNDFIHLNEVRRMEIDLMKENGWKVELESLHWLGMDFMSTWLEDVLLTNRTKFFQQSRLIRRKSNPEDCVDDNDFIENVVEQSQCTKFDPRIAC
jgi:hypothetical protein